MKLKLELAISHYEGGVRGGGVTIAIRDEGSGVPFVELDLSHEDFGKALGSLRISGVDGEVRGLERVGLIRELKHIAVPRPPVGASREERIAHVAKSVKKHEHDGWEADVASACRTQQNGEQYVVTMRRYVSRELTIGS